MHISLWCSDMLHTSKHVVPLLPVPRCLISGLFASPVHSIQPSSLYTQETMQMDARSPTQNYKWKKICPFKVRKETRNIEQFLINHLQLRAKMGQKIHCPAGAEWRALLAVHCVALRFWSVFSTSAWATKHPEEHTSQSGLGRKASPSSLAPASLNTQHYDSQIHLATKHGEVKILLSCSALICVHHKSLPPFRPENSTNRGEKLDFYGDLGTRRYRRYYPLFPLLHPAKTLSLSNDKKIPLEIQEPAEAPKSSSLTSCPWVMYFFHHRYGRIAGTADNP